MNIRHFVPVLLVALSGLCFANEPVATSSPPYEPSFTTTPSWSFQDIEIAVFDKDSLPFPAADAIEIAETRVVTSAPFLRSDASACSIYFGKSRRDRLCLSVGRELPMHIG